MQITKHPILRKAYNLCLAIEELEAGEKQTKASVLASELMTDIDKLVDELKDKKQPQVWSG